MACRRLLGIGVEETDRIFVNCAGGVLSSVGKAHDTEIGHGHALVLQKIII